MSSIPVPQREAAGKLILIGRREFLAFPEWNLWRVRAKVDTGAYSSALGVADYQLIETPAGTRVRFRLPPTRRRRPEPSEVLEAPVEKLVTVCSSSGCRQSRPLI